MRANCSGLSDVSARLADTTFLLTHFARDREICGCGETLPLEFAVKKLTSDNCDLYHLRDRGAVQVIPHAPSQFLLNSSPILTRGAVQVGLKADLNVLDFENLRLCV